MHQQRIWFGSSANEDPTTFAFQGSGAHVDGVLENLNLDICHSNIIKSIELNDFSRHRNLISGIKRCEAIPSVCSPVCSGPGSIVKSTETMLEHVPFHAGITSFDGLLSRTPIHNPSPLTKRNEIMISRVSVHCPAPERVFPLSPQRKDP